MSQSRFMDTFLCPLLSRGARVFCGSLISAGILPASFISNTPTLKSNICTSYLRNGVRITPISVYFNVGNFEIFPVGLPVDKTQEHKFTPAVYGMACTCKTSIHYLLREKKQPLQIITVGKRPINNVPWLASIIL